MSVSQKKEGKTGGLVIFFIEVFALGMKITLNLHFKAAQVVHSLTRIRLNRKITNTTFLGHLFTEPSSHEPIGR